MNSKFIIAAAILIIVVYLIAPLPKPPPLEGATNQLASAFVKTTTVTAFNVVTTTSYITVTSPPPSGLPFNYTIAQCAPQGCDVLLNISYSAFAIWPGGQQALGPGSAKLTVPYGSTVYIQINNRTYNFVVGPEIVVNLLAFSSYCTSDCLLTGSIVVKSAVPTVFQLSGENIQQIQVQGPLARIQLRTPNPPPSQVCVTIDPPNSRFCAPVLFSPPRLLLNPVMYIAYSPTQYVVLLEAYNPGSAEYRIALMSQTVLGYGYYTSGADISTPRIFEMQLGPGERKYVYSANDAPSPISIMLSNGTMYVVQMPPFAPKMKYSLSVNYTASLPPKQPALPPFLSQVEEWAIVTAKLRLETQWAIYLPNFLRLWVLPQGDYPWHVQPLECSPTLASPVDGVAYATCWFWVPYKLSTNESKFGYLNGTLQAGMMPTLG